MKLTEKISLEKVFEKEYKIKLVEPENNQEAVITHFLHNSKNGVSQFYKKDAIEYANSRIMNNIYFKFKEHPGDFLRNTDVIELPNPQEDLESFLVQFLRSYQSDERVAFIDDLNKVLDNDFSNEKDKNNFIKIIGKKTEQEIKDEIQRVEIELKDEAYGNFYNLILTKQIEIIENGEK